MNAAEPAAEPIRDPTVPVRPHALASERKSNPPESASTTRPVPAPPAVYFTSRDTEANPAGGGQLDSPQVLLDDVFDALPPVGTHYHGFELLEELGRGSMGCAYLARQAGLVRRKVAVKITADPHGEIDILTQLQHTNVMPVYSVHAASPFTILCMPYVGRMTLSHLLQWLRGQSKLPESGKAIVEQLIAHNSELPDAASAPTLALLSQMSYTDAVLWLISRMCEGLIHAHVRGILHLDVKPANVLLSDEGQPLLLDFNVSVDLKPLNGQAPFAIGGTQRYMAPEQLLAYIGDADPLDIRTDIFSVGILLYELLTGVHPYEPRSDALLASIDDSVNRRKNGPPSVPGVSASVAAIIKRCLAPDPNDRYQNARDLREDLERQLSDRPLRYAAEPSLVERGRKWLRRHPTISTAMGVAFVGAFLVLVMASWLATKDRALQSIAAGEVAQIAYRAFQADYQNARARLYTRVNEPDQVRAGINHAWRALAHYPDYELPDWSKRPEVRALPENDRQQLRLAMGELLVLLARAKINVSTLENQRGAAVEGLTLSERAEFICPEMTEGQSFWDQRAALLRAAGRNAESVENVARTMPVLSARDLYWQASDYMLQGQTRRALPLLQDAVRREPQNFWAWWVLGNGYDRLQADLRAEACYDTCIALWPDFHWAYFNRGLARYRQRQYEQAARDFDETLTRQPGMTEALLNRALARQGMKNDKGAEADLTAALAAGASETRIYFLRHRVRTRLGDTEGAASDFAEGMRRQPTDEKSWVARGFARLDQDPDAARTDFEQALQINPRSLGAAESLAHVLSERLNKTDEALVVLDRAIEQHPESALLRCGRAVLLARQGRDSEARSDARAALQLDPGAAFQYQAACAFSLTAVRSPEDQHMALHLLRSAVRQGYGLDLLEKDGDLAPLRSTPEFRQLVNAARTLRSSSLDPVRALTLAK